jgi:hypothetical protein
LGWHICISDTTSSFFYQNFCTLLKWELSWGTKFMLRAFAETVGNTLNYSLQSYYAFSHVMRRKTSYIFAKVTNTILMSFTIIVLARFDLICKKMRKGSCLVSIYIFRYLGMTQSLVLLRQIVQIPKYYTLLYTHTLYCTLLYTIVHYCTNNKLMSFTTRIVMAQFHLIGNKIRKGSCLVPILIFKIHIVSVYLEGSHV